jgi:Fringe-like
VADHWWVRWSDLLVWGFWPAAEKEKEKKASACFEMIRALTASKSSSNSNGNSGSKLKMFVTILTLAFLVTWLLYNYNFEFKEAVYKLKDIDIYNKTSADVESLGLDKQLYLLPNLTLNMAVGLKTGKETFMDRVPIQLLTFLAKLDNVLIFSEISGRIGFTEMLDVIEQLYEGREKPSEWEDIVKHRKAATEKIVSGNSNEQKPDTSRIGWKVDAHKNLPGFVDLYTNFPDADWYMMIDDDTFVDLANLEDYLKRYNSNEEHYFGNAGVFAGCDGITEFGKGPYFAHG